MSTKTEIQAHIQNNLPSGAGILAADHRNVLKNANDSFLENAYATEIVDTHLTSNVFTLKAGVNVEYEIKILKQFRSVTLSGFVRCLSGYITRFAEITNAEFKPMPTEPFTIAPFTGSPMAYNSVGKLWTTLYNIEQPDSQTIGVYRGVGDGEISIPSGLINGYTIRFELKYNTEL